MTEQELNKALKVITDKIDDVKLLYLQKIGEQIKNIGELSQSNINRLIILSEMYEDIASINAEIAKTAGLNINQVYKIYQKALDDVYTDKRFARALKQTPLSVSAKQRLNKFVQSVSIQTAKKIVNLSNTTIADENYKEAVDKAIITVSSGLTDYNSAMRAVIRKIGTDGLQIEYPGSGCRRRLDSAVRQNILDGVRQIAQRGSIQMGEELGYDAYEIFAHAQSAPDHEPVQGRVFLKAEFEKMQNGDDFVDIDGKRYAGFRRPIGQWNCMHLAMSFSTEFSSRVYSDEQLEEFKKQNEKGCDIDGKHYTLYEVRQLMRKVETEIRREKDIAVTARAADDRVLREECQRKINSLAEYYSRISRISGIPAQMERTRVGGFRMVKVKG